MALYCQHHAGMYHLQPHRTGKFHTTGIAYQQLHRRDHTPGKVSGHAVRIARARQLFSDASRGDLSISSSLAASTTSEHLMQFLIIFRSYIPVWRELNNYSPTLVSMRIVDDILESRNPQLTIWSRSVTQETLCLSMINTPNALEAARNVDAFIGKDSFARTENHQGGGRGAKQRGTTADHTQAAHAIFTE